MSDCPSDHRPYAIETRDILLSAKVITRICESIISPTSQKNRGKKFTKKKLRRGILDRWVSIFFSRDNPSILSEGEREQSFPYVYGEE